MVRQVTFEPAMLGGVFGKSAPAAPNFENFRRRPGTDPVTDVAVFVVLALFEAHVRAIEDGRGIGHAGIQPKAVEIITQIIMGHDVLLRALAGVAIEDMADHVDPANKRSAYGKLSDIVEIGREEAQHGGQVRRGPVAIHIRLGKADIPACHCAFHEVVIVHDNGRVRTGFVMSVFQDTITRQDKGYAATLCVQQREGGQTKACRNILEVPNGLGAGVYDLGHAASLRFPALRICNGKAMVEVVSGGLGLLR